MNTTTLIPFEYQSHIITFTGDAYVNLTEMCATCDEKPVHFLRLESTQRFITALAADTGLSQDELVITNHGGAQRGFKVRNPHFENGAAGTWAHRYLALECARWLKPELAIWTNKVFLGVMSGQVPHPAMDYRQISKLEGQAREMSRTAHATRQRIYDVLDVPGNFSVFVYALCAGLPTTRHPAAKVGVVSKHRCLAAGLPIGKVRQQTQTRERRSEAGTYPVAVLRAAWLHFGYEHETPDPEVMLARWRPMLSIFHRLNASPLALTN